MGHGNYAKFKFKVYVSTGVTTDAASYSKFPAVTLGREESKPKIWMNSKHCLSSAKGISIEEAHHLLYAGTAATDAENL